MREITNVRLSRDIYDRLVQVKGFLIARRSKNVSIDETVEELLRVYLEKEGLLAKEGRIVVRGK